MRAQIILPVAALFLVFAQDPWARANNAVVRLAPSQFRALPPAALRDLDRRGCRIPQSSYDEKPAAPHNVIRGAFTGANRVDWAVLCSVRDTSQILVYHDGGASATDSLAKEADLGYLQGLGAGRIAFSRKIDVATAASIRAHPKAHDGPAPPPNPDHAGIDDGFLGKGSVIYYAFGGTWLRLQGAD